MLRLFFIATILQFSSTTFASSESVSRRHFLSSCAAALGVPFLSVPRSTALTEGTVAWEIKSPATGEVLSAGRRPFKINQSVGELTTSILQDSELEFHGSESGIYSISNSPTGDDALEVLSDTRMRSYGWCYEVNGIQPQVMPNEFFLDEEEVRLVWFWGYVEYDRGQWDSQCRPAS